MDGMSHLWKQLRSSEAVLQRKVVGSEAAAGKKKTARGSSGICSMWRAAHLASRAAAVLASQYCQGWHLRLVDVSAAANCYIARGLVLCCSSCCPYGTVSVASLFLADIAKPHSTESRGLAQLAGCCRAFLTPRAVA